MFVILSGKKLFYYSVITLGLEFKQLFSRMTHTGTECSQVGQNDFIIGMSVIFNTALNASLIHIVTQAQDIQTVDVNSLNIFKKGAPCNIQLICLAAS